jgi:Protein of unknown function (DUF2568)
VGLVVKGLRGAVLTIRFLCELAMLGVLAYWGAVTFDGSMAFVVGVAAPLVAVVIWGTFVAPKARRPVSVVVRLVIEDALFAVTTLALFAAGKPTLAVVFAIAAFTTSGLNAWFQLASRQEGTPG